MLTIFLAAAVGFTAPVMTSQGLASYSGDRPMRSLSHDQLVTLLDSGVMIQSKESISSKSTEAEAEFFLQGRVYKRELHHGRQEGSFSIENNLVCVAIQKQNVNCREIAKDSVDRMYWKSINKDELTEIVITRN